MITITILLVLAAYVLGHEEGLKEGRRMYE